MRHKNCNNWLIGFYTDFWRQEFEFAQGLTTEKKLT